MGRGHAFSALMAARFSGCLDFLFSAACLALASAPLRTHRPLCSLDRLGHWWIAGGIVVAFVRIGMVSSRSRPVCFGLGVVAHRWAPFRWIDGYS